MNITSINQYTSNVDKTLAFNSIRGSDQAAKNVTTIKDKAGNIIAEIYPPGTSSSKPLSYRLVPLPIISTLKPNQINRYTKFKKV